MKLFFVMIAALFFAASPAMSNGTLVLLVDMSQSISEEDVNLQLESYAAAMEWITPLEHINIEVILFAKEYKHISSGSRDAAAYAFRNPGSIDRSSTCLHEALVYVNSIYELLPKPVIIDISGDGEDNCGIDEYAIHRVLDDLEQKGATINTLMIPVGDGVFRFLSDPSEVQNKKNELQHFFSSLTRGPDSFFMYIENFYDFEEAIIKKIVKEIS